MGCMNQPKKSNKSRLPQGLEILYEDADILAVSKPSGLLTIATETRKTRTAYYALTDYVRKGNVRSRNRLFIVHRLDQDTSGVLLFAKHELAKQYLQQNWDKTKKLYLAVVYGQVEPKEDVIESYLMENRAFKVYSTMDAKQGKLAKTAYRVLDKKGGLSLLEITLLTGRKNQIRVHLSDRECPIVGDRKYGRPDDPHRRLALHAESISFPHPADGKPMTLTAKPPAYFRMLMKSAQQESK